MMNLALPQAWRDQWRDEWARNPRLRLAVLLALALLAVWALLVAADCLDERVAERDRLAAQVRRLQSLTQDRRWEAVAGDVRAIDAQWRARLWREPTEGRMQAALQDWLRAQVVAAGLAPRELLASVLPPASPPDATQPPGTGAAQPPQLPQGVRVVRARVAVEVSPLRLHELLARLAQAPGHLRLSRLAVSNAERQAAELEVEALFTADEPAAVGDGAGSR